MALSLEARSDLNKMSWTLGACERHYSRHHRQEVGRVAIAVAVIFQGCRLLATALGAYECIAGKAGAF